jgi:hypothetical protein
VIGWTFDIDTVTFDASVPTWDGGLWAGNVQLELANGNLVPVVLANVRAEAFTYDRSMFRSPYGTVWHQEGDFRRLVESITVQAQVVDDAGGISDAAGDADALALLLPDVVRVESNWGAWDIAALESYSRQPVESGYRFDVQFVTFDGIH